MCDVDLSLLYGVHTALLLLGPLLLLILILIIIRLIIPNAAAIYITHFKISAFLLLQIEVGGRRVSTLQLQIEKMQKLYETTPYWSAQDAYIYTSQIIEASDSD